MQIVRASSAKLKFSSVLSLSFILLYIIVARQVDSGFGALACWAIVGMNILSLLKIFNLSQHVSPIVQLDRQGLMITPALSPTQLVPWAEVKEMKVTSYSYNFIPVPFSSRLVLKFKTSGHIAGYLMVSPTSWFKTLTVNALWVEGGTSALKTMVEAQQLFREVADLEAFRSNGFPAATLRDDNMGKRPTSQLPTLATANPTAIPAAKPKAEPMLNGRPLSEQTQPMRGFGRKGM
jgi:hypothetical protein